MSINAGTVVGYLELDASKFKSGLNTAMEQLKGFTDKSNSAGTRFQALGSSLKTIGSNMSKYVTLPLAGIGTASVATAANFEKSMSQVAATMGMTAEEINNGSESYKKLEQAALDMGATTQFSASEASEALNYLALAGYDVDKSVSTLPTVLNLAAAGGLELGYASDVMTDAMSALGLETSQAEGFVDQLAKTSQKSNTSVGQLGEAILTVGGTAKVLAGGTTEMNTALGILADNGIKGAEGGTALRNVILSLSAPTDKAAKTMKELGLEVFDAQGNMRPLNDIFKDLDGTLSTMTQGEQTKVLSELFNKVDLKSVNALLANSGERFNELSGYISDSEGAAAAMADTMNNNLSGQLTLLKSGLEGAAISIGNALLPVIKVLVEWINNLVTWFNNLNPGIQTAITIFGLVVAAIGPVLLIVGHLCTAIGGLITFFSAGGAGAGILSAAIAAITGPIGLTIAAITALIAAGVLLISNWDEIKTFLLSCFEAIKNGLDSAFSWICNKLGADSNEIKSIISDTWNNVKDTINNLIQQIKSIISDTWDIIKECIDESVGAIYDVIKETWEKIKQALTIAGKAIDQLIKGDWEGAKQTIKTAVDMIKTSIQDAWTKIKEIISNLGRDILEYIKFCWKDIKTSISTAITNIKTSVSNGWNNLKSATKTAFDNIKAIASTVWNGIKSDISNKVEGIKSSVSTKINSIKSTVSSVFSSLTNIMTAPFRTAQSVINGILGGISRTISSITSAAKKVTSLFRTVEPPIQEQEPALYNEVDYSKAKFNYAKAKQTTISDVIAKNNSMVESFKDFGKNIKADNTKAKVNNESVININLTIDKMLNSDNRSINDIANELAANLKRRNLALGGVR